VRAAGRSRAGYPFLREQTLTPAVWHGGDRPGEGAGAGGGGTGACGCGDPLCCIVRGLVGDDGIFTPQLEERLGSLGIDARRLRRILARCCPPPPDPRAEG
jgi:hypothetical protein